MGDDSQESFGEPTVDPAKMNVAGGGTTSNTSGQAAKPEGVDPDDALTGGEPHEGRPSERDHDL